MHGRGVPLKAVLLTQRSLKANLYKYSWIMWPTIECYGQSQVSSCQFQSRLSISFKRGEKQMNTHRKTTVSEGGKLANANPQTAIKENKMKITASQLIRWAGISAMVAGVLFMIVGMFHPLNVISSVTTTRWAVVHILASAMCFFILLGMAGLYARQAEESGWLG